MEFGTVYHQCLRTIQAAGCNGTWTLLGRKTDREDRGWLTDPEDFLCSV